MDGSTSLNEYIDEVVAEKDRAGASRVLVEEGGNLSNRQRNALRGVICATSATPPDTTTAH